ncbi:Glycosyl hydrolase [Trema orientale]|uniref:Glycosyl hydrolase n=1 Tax=Trema orientale TaxID=63057 RepID=A0A2P5EXS4_TREOI|nr:Glycosyl hydrolase [Trema orientale]
MVQTTMFSPSPRALQLNFHFSPSLATNQKLFSRGLVRINTKAWRHSMFLSSKPVLKDGALSIGGKDALTGVPDNVVVTPLTNSSAFVGATSVDESSRLVFKLGVIQDIRLLCLFRFKMWWMIPRVGNSGSDVPVETQMLLLEASKGQDLEDSNETSYIVFLPIIDGDFRSSLQGNSSNELEFCVESGDPAIVTSQSLKAVFVNSGNHPFDLMQESMKILEKYTGTFAHRESKQATELTNYI